MRHVGPSALFLALLAACGDVRASDERELLSAVPPDAAIVVSLIDGDEIRSRARDNAIVRLFAEEAWGDARRALDRALREGSPIDLDVMGGLADLDGELVAYFRFDDRLPKPEFGVVVEATDENARLVGLWSAFLGLARAEGEMREVEHAGVTLHVLDDRPQSVFFRTDTACGIVVAGQPDDDVAIASARGVLDRLSSGDPGFRGNPRYAAAVSGGLANPAVRVIVDRLGALAVDTGAVPDMDADALKVVGIDQMEWGLLDLDIGADERLALHASVDAPDDGFVRELLEQLGPAPLDLLERAPASAHAAGVGHLDALGVFRAIRSFQQRTAPDETENFARGLERVRERLGFDLEQDALARLTGRFATASVPISLSGAELRTLTESSRSPLAMTAAWTGAAIAMEVDEPARAEKATLALDHALERSMPPRDDFLFGDPVARRVGPSMELVGDSVVLAAHGSALRAVGTALRSDADRSFADHPGVRARARSAKGASLVGVARTSTVVDTIVGFLRNQSIAAAMGSNRELEWMATVHWPHPATIVDALDGLVVQSVKFDGDRLSLEIEAR